MKTTLSRWTLLLCLPALLVAGCIGQETLTSWAAPSAPADAGLLLRVRPTLDIPPGTWVYEVNLVMSVTPDDPALASKYGSMVLALPYSTSAKKLGNETVLLRLPPGTCSVSHAYMAINSNRFNPIYVRATPPEKTLKNIVLRAGEVTPVGEFKFTLTSVFEAAPATNTGWVLSSKSSSSVTTGSGIEKEVLEAALGIAATNKRHAAWRERLETALQKRNEPPPAPPKPPATPPAPEKPPAPPPAPPAAPEKSADPPAPPPVPEKPAANPAP